MVIADAEIDEEDDDDDDVVGAVPPCDAPQLPSSAPPPAGKCSTPYTPFLHLITCGTSLSLMHCITFLTEGVIA